MSASIATYEAVKSAALEIMRDPRRSLTCEAIIEALGGGSKATVAPLLRRVREELGQRGGTDESVPAHLAAEAEALVKKLHAAAKEEARREYDGDIARMSRILAGLQSDVDAGAAEGEGAEARVAQLTTELQAATRTIADLETQVLLADDAKTLLEANARRAQQELDRALETIAMLKHQAEENGRIDDRLRRLEAAIP